LYFKWYISTNNSYLVLNKQNESTGNFRWM